MIRKLSLVLLLTSAVAVGGVLAQGFSGPAVITQPTTKGNCVQIDPVRGANYISDAGAPCGSGGGGGTPGNPTATIGAAFVNGVASTYMRSDAAPKLPATLPALSGVNLTNLNGSNVASGTIAIARGGFGADNSASSGVPLFATGAITFTSTSGTGNFARVTSPTFVTPTLGAATATSINGNTITTGTGVLTLGAGKTLTASNTLTFAGTDGSTLNVGAGGTLGSNAFTSTAYAPLASPTFTGTVTVPNGGVLNTPTSLTLTNATGLVPSTGLATTGTPSASTCLLGNNTWGSCAGGGGVTTTGSPVSGNLTKFSGASSITNGDLSGDVTTSGALVSTLATVNSHVGSFTNASITVNAKGLITAASSGAGGGGISTLTAGTGINLSSGATCTSTCTISNTLSTNAQTGTSYATLASDGGKIVTFANASSIAVSLSTTGTSGFGAGFGVDYYNIGAGTVTVTGASNINGASTLVIRPNQDCSVFSDGTVYHAACSSLPPTLGSTVLTDGTTISTVAGLTLTAPTLTTPALGVATATSINGLTISSSTGTLAIANGKTATISNTLTFTGTDSSSVNFGAGGTVLYSGGSYVASLAGTANEITASASTGAVTLSLPSALTFTGKTVTGGTFASSTFTAPILGTPASGNAVNMTGYTLTNLAGLGTGVGTALGNNLSAAGGVTTTVASGTSALGTSAISSGACATVVTTSATNVATTDVINAGFNGDPTAVTGYAPATSGMLTIISYPSANNVNFKVCNNTSSSITPGAITLNWRVVR